uniref:Uncharacterized protein n=1 Tax=Plectus sambesii TaxID=2011161 RepID=A0A914UQF1_9BILA
MCVWSVDYGRRRRRNDKERFAAGGIFAFLGSHRDWQPSPIGCARFSGRTAGLGAAASAVEVAGGKAADSSSSVSFCLLSHSHIFQNQSKTRAAPHTPPPPPPPANRRGVSSVDSVEDGQSMQVPILHAFNCHTVVGQEKLECTHAETRTEGRKTGNVSLRVHFAAASSSSPSPSPPPLIRYA